MLFAADIAVEQEVTETVIMTAFFIFTRFWCTLTHVQLMRSNNLVLDTDSRSWSTFYKTCAHKRRESYPIFERLCDAGAQPGGGIWAICPPPRNFQNIA